MRHAFRPSCFPQKSSRAKQKSDLTTSNEKFTCLALLRHELRWTAKRNVKETELLIRTDSEPADKVSAPPTTQIPHVITIYAHIFRSFHGELIIKERASFRLPDLL